MDGAPKDLPVGRAPGKGIPQHRAHTPMAPLLPTFLRHHAQNGPTVEGPLLDLSRHGKYQFADPVIRANGPIGWPAMFPEVAG